MFQIRTQTMSFASDSKAVPCSADLSDSKESVSSVTGPRVAVKRLEQQFKDGCVVDGGHDDDNSANRGSSAVVAASSSLSSSSTSASSSLGFAAKGDAVRKRSEIYAVNNYLKSLEKERFEKLCADMKGEELSDMSWGSDYSSEDLAPFGSSSRRFPSSVKISTVAVKKKKPIKQPSSSSKLQAAGMGGV
jgi:hypothetical protein